MATKAQGADFPSRFGRFEGQVSVAKHQHEEYVETDQDIIDFLQPNGLGSVAGKENIYFVYKGVKIFPVGVVDKILENENIPMEEQLHGKSNVGIREVLSK